VIDAHHHVWDLGVRDQDWITGAELAPLRRNFLISEYREAALESGVTASVLVQTVVDAGETPELLALAGSDDLVGGVVGWVDLTSARIAGRLVALRELPGGSKLRGIRHQVQSEADPGWLTRADVVRGLAAVAAARLVYDLVITAGQLPAAAAAARAVPGLVFVLDHLGKPPIASGAIEPWASDLRRLAELPNTVAKLSGLVTEADWGRWQPSDLRPYVEVALEAFGPDRLMFGSDWPVCTLAASFGTVVAAARDLTAALSPAEQAAIFTGTATRVYGL
jgi:L-fuconolactonase